MVDDLITQRYLCPTSWYTLSSNEMVCNILRMEGAFCLLYTLFLEIVYTVTRHQTTAIQHQQREKGGGMLRAVVCILC